jgi:hypothetical protein
MLSFYRKKSPFNQGLIYILYRIGLRCPLKRDIVIIRRIKIIVACILLRG